MVPKIMMSNRTEPTKKKLVASYINESLKEVFADYASDDIPEQMLDMLNVLRAQDEARKKDDD